MCLQRSNFQCPDLQNRKVHISDRRYCCTLHFTRCHPNVTFILVSEDFVCSLPHDSGGCDRKEFRYYYNSLEVTFHKNIVCSSSACLIPCNFFQRRCKLFVYGGCKGNQNNFVSELDCLTRCGDKSAISGLPRITETQIQEIGEHTSTHLTRREIIIDLMLKYDGDNASLDKVLCLEHWWSEYLSQCGAYEPSSVVIILEQHFQPSFCWVPLFLRCLETWFIVLKHFILDQCSQVKDEGICPGNVPRFYFDQSAKRCLLFSYGGCGGNTNNFLTEESCIGTCGGPSGALIHAIQLHGNNLMSSNSFISNNFRWIQTSEANLQPSNQSRQLSGQASQILFRQFRRDL